MKKNIRVKSGNFRQRVNSDIHLQTVKIQMRRLIKSRLIRIFAVCLVNFLFNNSQIKETRSLSEFSELSEFTRLYLSKKKMVK